MALELESWEAWCSEIFIREVLESAVHRSNPDSSKHKRSHSCFKGLEMSFFRQSSHLQRLTTCLSKIGRTLNVSQSVTSSSRERQMSFSWSRGEGWRANVATGNWMVVFFHGSLDFTETVLRLYITLRCLWQEQGNEQCKKAGKICASAWQLHLSQVSASAVWSWLATWSASDFCKW